MVKVTPELALSFLVSYRDRPDCKNSWPIVEKAIKDFAEANKTEIPKDVYVGIYQFDYKILRNFEKRGTALKPKVFDLLCLFFHSEAFLHHVPRARNIIQKRKESVQDGRILARYLGISRQPTGQLFEDIAGYWISNPATYGLERPLYENDKNQRLLVYREILYITHLFSEPFAFVHCYLQSILNDVGVEKTYDPAYLRMYGIEYDELGVLSGYIFKDIESECYRCFLYSRYSGKFAYEFEITKIRGKEIGFKSIGSSILKSDHVSVRGLRKIQSNKLVGSFSGKEMRSDFPSRTAVNLFDTIKESVIANG